jgi:hypothetical protein
MSDQVKPKKRSRWVKGSGVDRYTQPDQNANDKALREGPGWKNGAKVVKKS